MTFNDFFPLVRDLGSVGLIFWLVWRTTQKTLPDIVKQAEVSQEKARDDFRDMIREQRCEHGKQMQEHRTFYAEQVKLCRDHALDMVKKST